MKKIGLLFGAIGTLIGLNSCVKDTCNANLGNTFEAIEFDSTHYGDLDLSLYFSSSTLAKLPSSYYENVTGADSVTITESTIVSTSSTLQINLTEEFLPHFDSIKSYLFTYQFEDRRNYIDCKHPGSSDRYILLINFDLAHADSAQYNFSNFGWQEFFIAGYL